MIVLSCVQFNAISVMNSSSLMTRGERSILNFDPRCLPDARFVFQSVFDFLPVLKGGDSLDHAVSWFKGGSH